MRMRWKAAFKILAIGRAQLVEQKQWIGKGIANKRDTPNGYTITILRGLTRTQCCQMTLSHSNRAIVN